ncbi:MAG: hypothetical protein V4506_15145 [Bacteroidota bacterium]
MEKNTFKSNRATAPLYKVGQDVFIYLPSGLTKVTIFSVHTHQYANGYQINYGFEVIHNTVAQEDILMNSNHARKSLYEQGKYIQSQLLL